MSVVFAYVPVVHKQVLEFLQKYKNESIWLLDNEAGAQEYVYLERDARALPARLVQTELEAHGFKNVSVVAPAELPQKTQGIEKITIPEDEAVRFFLEKYAPDVVVEAENIFIRWTQKLSTTEYEVAPGRTITHDEFAKEVMSQLEDETQKSSDWWRQIASAVVKDGEVVALSHNHHLPSSHSLAINGDPRSNLDAGQGPGIYTSIHAEAAVIADCAKQGIATAGADMYVTTFPCPTCARSMIEAGFKRLFYAKGYSLLDAEELLQSAGIEIILIAD